MELYIVLLFFVYAVSFADITNMNKKYKIYLGCSIFLISVLIGGLRYNTGTDWAQYYFFFTDNHTFENFENSPFEYGYILLNYLLKSITEQYNILLIVMTAMVCLLKFSCIFRYAHFPLVVLLLNFAFYLGDFFAVRQILALAITVYSVRYIIEKDLKRFLLFLLFAVLFHRTAIIFLFAYWIFPMKINLKHVVVVIFACLALSQIQMIDSITSMNLDSMYMDKLQLYQAAKENDISFGTASSNEEKLLNSTIKKICFLSLFFFIRKRVAQQNENYNGFLNLSIFSNIIFAFFMNTIPEIALRLVVYYNFFEIFLLSNFLFITDKWYFRIFILLILGVIAFSRYYYGLYQFYDEYVPYNSIL